MGRARGARTVQEDTAAPKEDKRERQSGRKSLVAEDAESEGALALPLGLVLFAVVLVTYVRTAYPSVPGGDPDVRPVAIGEVDVCAFTRAAYRDVTHSVLADYLAPQQVAVGISGGLSILVHGVRALLRMRRDFVVVRLDLRNAYNEIDRAVLLQRMAAIPELGPLARFFHTMHTAESALYLGDRRRLFAGVDGRSGDSASGVRQGSTESSSAFCVGIHPEMVTLDGALRDEGGGAWGDMDDIYAVGPAAHVFPAIDRGFLARGA